jgi:uncharacterized protein YigE (DUF2233 family)
MICRSYIILLSCLGLHLLSTISYASDKNYDPSINWRKLADRLDLGVARLDGGLLPAEITLLRASPKLYRPQVVRAAQFGKERASVAWLAKSSKMPICINASFFDPDGKPLGLLVSQGIRYSTIHKGGSTLTGAFLAFRDRYEIMQRDTIGEAFGLEAVQAGPRLVVSGSIAKGIKSGGQKSRRSGICLTKNGHITIFALTSALRGASLYELSALLVTPESGCRDALNFDGGGSSQLYVDKALPGVLPGFQGVDLPGRDDVPVALCLNPESY